MTVVLAAEQPAELPKTAKPKQEKAQAEPIKLVEQVKTAEQL